MQLIFLVWCLSVFINNYFLSLQLLIKMNIDDITSEDELLENDDNKDLDFEIQNYVDGINNEDSDEFSDNHDKNKEDDNQHEMQEEQEEEENIEENEYIGPVLPDGHRFDRKLICIKYPGNVINPDRAIKTLGGLKAISTAVDTPNRRLELRFRPDDGYAKPACGDRHSKMAFLLRVRIKKHRIEKIQENEQKSKEDINVETVKNVMENMSLSNDSLDSITDQNNDQNNEQNNDQDDVQNNQDDLKENNIITDLAEQIQNCNLSTKTVNNSSDKVFPSTTSNTISDTLPDISKNLFEIKKNISPTFDRNKYEDLSQDEQYELPKLKILGRIDTEFQFNNLCDFQYLPMTQKKDNPEVLECIYDKMHPTGIPSLSWLTNDVPYFLPPAAFSRMDSVHQYVPKTESKNAEGKNKKRRGGFINYTCFQTQDVPSKPPHGIETAMKVKFLQNTHIEKIRQMFEERPIWSKNAILYNTRFTTEQLKILLPSVAYYFVTGPWRIMWIRLGYDPRKDIKARKYQTLDYRLKAMRGLGSTIKCKRNYSEYTLPYKSAPATKPKTSILTPNLSMEPNETKETEMNENMYIYREGMVPPSRQMFYQYCDILVEEVQEMLAKLPDPLPGTRCHEKRGWLPIGFDSQCREIINKQIRNVLRKKMNIPEDHPTTLPRKRKWGPGYRINRINFKRRKANAKNQTSTSKAQVSSSSKSKKGVENVNKDE
ncbi:hypothetical protein M0802_006818 [Mischocyttarus mexicanus]|nr:hypothetical protein M0802_006818 [Mischocyttarus mexicanus]